MSDPAFDPLRRPPPLLGAEQRRRAERRARRRRLAEASAPPEERRSGRDRRRGDRRESAAGHLRNALQILLQLSIMVDPQSDTQELISSTMRRIWLALSQIEGPEGPLPEREQRARAAPGTPGN